MAGTSVNLKDDISIAAPRETVFAALNDPGILRQAIPGCEELEAIGDDQFAAVVGARVGPLKAKFKGQVTLMNLNPPVSYTLAGEGKGGPAGHAKITASVALKEDGAGTILIYDVNADIGGKLAQLGGHLVENTARKLAAEFFRNFEQLIATTTAADEAEPVVVPPPTVERGTSPLPWVIGLAALLGLVGWLLW
tara:strand:- start:194 stop:775 length:582 start_codon:yes stop_codon:yes gene_type:complete